MENPHLSAEADYARPSSLRQNQEAHGAGHRARGRGMGLMRRQVESSPEPCAISSIVYASFLGICPSGSHGLPTPSERVPGSASLASGDFPPASKIPSGPTGS